MSQTPETPAPALMTKEELAGIEARWGAPDAAGVVEHVEGEDQP